MSDDIYFDELYADSHWEYLAMVKKLAMAKREAKSARRVNRKGSARRAKKVRIIRAKTDGATRRAGAAKRLKTASARPAETADARSVQRFCVISPSVTAEGERRTWHNDEGGAVMHAIGIMKGHDGRARPMRLLIVKVMAVVEREISEPRVRPPNKGESW